MRQIEVYENENRQGVYQTFVLDNRHDFPYYRPLYLISMVRDEREAAKSAKNNYLWNLPTREQKEAGKKIKVIAKLVNTKKDLLIKAQIEGFNDALKIPSKTVSEIMCRQYEEAIHELILNYNHHKP